MMGGDGGARDLEGLTCSLQALLQETVNLRFGLAKLTAVEVNEETERLVSHVNELNEYLRRWYDAGGVTGQLVMEMPFDRGAAEWEVGHKGREGGIVPNGEGD